MPAGNVQEFFNIGVCFGTDSELLEFVEKRISRCASIVGWLEGSLIVQREVPPLLTVLTREYIGARGCLTFEYARYQRA